MLQRLPEEITSPRLLLRRPIEVDAAAIFMGYTQDRQVCHFMVWQPHTREEQTQGFIASCIEAWRTEAKFPYIITEHGSNTAIGMIEARPLGTTVDVGYVLAQAHWGKGLMPEALQALTAVALNETQAFRVQATCDVENIASQRTLEKSGFRREGRLERHTVHPNISPEPRACFMYAKCR